MGRILKPALWALFFSIAASCAFADGYKSIAHKLAKSSRRTGVKKIAILPFIHLNRTISAGTVATSERLTRWMGEQRGLEIIERQLLEKILGEESLRLTGALDPDNSRGIGKILNADAVISGTLLENKKGLVEIYARLIRIHDGKILASAEATVKKDWIDPEAARAENSFENTKAPHLELSHVSMPHKLYRSRCAQCHGEDGKGGNAPFNSLATSKTELDLTKSSVQTKRDPYLASQIIAGGRHMPAFGNLPGFKRELNNTEITELVAYIRTLGTKERKLMRENPAAESYRSRCSICHGEDGQGTHVSARLLNVNEVRLDLTRKDLSDLSVERLDDILKKGKGKMPEIGSTISSQETAELLSYLKNLSKP